MSSGPPLFLGLGADTNVSGFGPKPASGTDPLRTLAIGVLGEPIARFSREPSCD
jgi:hypothetical protein